MKKLNTHNHKASLIEQVEQVCINFDAMAVIYKRVIQMMDNPEIIKIGLLQDATQIPIQYTDSGDCITPRRLMEEASTRLSEMASIYPYIAGNRYELSCRLMDQYDEKCRGWLPVNDNNVESIRRLLPLSVESVLGAPLYYWHELDIDRYTIKSD